MLLRWRHNEQDGVSIHQPHECLLKRLFRHRSNKTSKLRVTVLCEGNSPVTGEFLAQRASNAENVSIWWRHHVFTHHLSFVSGHALCNVSISVNENSTGHITSFNYPENYPRNTFCMLTFEAHPSNLRIRLNFRSHYGLESSPGCIRDYMHIGNNIKLINQPSMTSYLFCGVSPPEQIVSRGPELWVVFRSDSHTTGIGYSFQYDVLPVGESMEMGYSTSFHRPLYIRKITVCT